MSNAATVLMCPFMLAKWSGELEPSSPNGPAMRPTLGLAPYPSSSTTRAASPSWAARDSGECWRLEGDSSMAVASINPQI